MYHQNLNCLNSYIRIYVSNSCFHTQSKLNNICSVCSRQSSIVLYNIFFSVDTCYK